MANVSSNGLQGQQRIGPSLRARYITRAGTLVDPATRDGRRFLRNVARARRAWDAMYPRLAIGEPDWFPESECGPSINYIIMPPALARIRRAHDARGEDYPDVEHWLWRRWARLAFRLCEWGWPAPYYHNWMIGRGLHPAVQFVSACLVWRPESVPPEAILAGGIEPEALPFNPHDPRSIPMVTFFRTYARAIVDDVREALKRGDTIDSAWFESLILDAISRAMEAKDAQFHANLEQLFWYIPILPDPVSTDSAAVLAAMRHAAEQKYGDADPVPSHVRDLAASGMSKNRISKLVGIDRGTVSRHLGSA
jgi:hypothetical protein